MATRMTISAKQFQGVARHIGTSSFLRARPVKVLPPRAESIFPFYDPWFETSPRGPHPRTKEGSKVTITMIPGVGIGKEMLDATMDVFNCSGAPINAEWVPELGHDSLNLMKLSLRRNGVAMKGNIEERSTMDIVNEDDESLNFLLLEALDLFANVTYLRGFKALAERDARHFKYMDVIVIRSNTEGEYALLEHQPVPGAFEHLRVISRYNTRRVAEFAFQLAKKENRNKVSILHQKHTMPLSEGVFLDEFLQVASHHPDVEHEVLNHHNASSMLIKGGHLDIIVSNSVYCSQLVDFMIGMIGGGALVAQGSYSNRFAVFEPSVNSRSRRLVGKCEANPTAFLLCGSLALDHCGYPELSCVIREAIENAFDQGVMTKDLGGTASTQEFIEQVIKHIQGVVPRVICKYDKHPPLNVKMPTEWAPEKSGLFQKIPEKTDTDECSDS